MNRSRPLLLLVGLAVLACALAACGAAAPAPSAETKAPEAPNAVPPMAGGSGAGGAPAPAAGAPAPGGGAAATPINAAGVRNALGLDRKIIRTGTLTLTVKEVGSVVDRATGIALGYGGWIAGSQVGQVAEGKTSATLTIKVPVDRYDELMRDLRGLGTVESERTTSQDVTDEYEDVQAQIANLKLLEERYQDVLRRATSVDDILKVTQRLTEVRGQIDRLQGRLNSLSRRTDYSEITLQLMPEGLATARPGWQISAEFAAAFRALVASLQFLATAAIWILIAGSPFLVLIVLAVFLWRRLRRRSRPVAPSPPSTPPAPSAPTPTPAA